MNAEERKRRLAVLDKRSRAISPTLTQAELNSELIDLDNDDSQHPSKRTKLDSGVPSGQNVVVIDLDESDEELQKAIRLSLIQEEGEEIASGVTKDNKTFVGDSPPMKYTYGEVLLTHVEGHTQKSHHVSLDQLWQRTHLRRAVLASFQIDLEWLLTKLDFTRTPIHLVCHAKDEGTRVGLTRWCKSLPKVYPVFPNMDKVNCMHSKLQLLFFDDFLRVVVPSANLVPFDWGAGGLMENVLYVQDFPLKQSHGEDDDTQDESGDEEDAHRFLQDLTYFLERASYPRQIIDECRNYDFQRTKHVQFVGSIGGENHGSQQIQQTGIVRLAHCVRAFYLNQGAFTVDFLTSSLGALNKSFVTSFMRACAGQELVVNPPATTNTNTTATEYETICRDLHILFPTESCVQASRAGHAGTVCFQRTYYNKPEFPKQSLFGYSAVRKSVLSHCKIIVCQSKANRDVGWAYVGSANCSASAWGDKIVKDKRTKQDKLTLRNWEAGVVVPLRMVKGRLPMTSDLIQNTSPWYFTEH